MKKARIMLAAIAVVAIVGGTMAGGASAHRVLHTVYTTDAVGHKAINPVVSYTFDLADQGTILDTYASAFNQDAVQTTIYKDGN